MSDPILHIEVRAPILADADAAASAMGRPRPHRSVLRQHAGQDRRRAVRQPPHLRGARLGLQQARLHHGVPASRNGRAIGDLQDPDALLRSTTSLVAKLFFGSFRFLYEMCYLDV